VALTGDGHLVASGADDETVRLWDAATGKQLAAFQQAGGRVNAVAFSPDGALLASGSRDGPIRLWDVAAVLKAGK
jgi:WD40 repeat protein